MKRTEEVRSKYLRLTIYELRFAQVFETKS
jgi:hypothetical protein